MDLLCYENQCECRAFPDRVLLNDDRVLQNLLQTEERYSPSTSYFECVQKELTPNMRKVVAEWMLEKCELLILSKLKWDISAVTPQDFLRHILVRLPIDRSCWDERMMQRHAQTFIALCARDLKFLTYTPSMIASASIAAALQGLEWTSKSGYSLSDLLNLLHKITSIERDYLEGCLHQIEEMVTSTLNARNASGQGNDAGAVISNSGNTGEQVALEKVLEHDKAGTPTDVRHVHF